MQSIGMFEYARNSDWLDAKDKECGWDTPCDYIGSLTYLQISIAIELVIFSCRAPGFVLAPKYLWGDGRASWKLVVGVMASNLLVSVLGGLGWIIYPVHWLDLLYIWVYNFVCLI